MAKAGMPLEFWIVLGLWFPLMIAGTALFYFGKDASLKRRLWPGYLVVGGILFVSIIWVIGFPREVLFIMVPAVAVIMGLNIKSTQFCDGCGALVPSKNFLNKPDTCPKCGLNLVP